MVFECVGFVRFSFGFVNAIYMYMLWSPYKKHRSTTTVTLRQKLQGGYFRSPYKKHRSTASVALMQKLQGRYFYRWQNTAALQERQSLLLPGRIRLQQSPKSGESFALGSKRPVIICVIRSTNRQPTAPARSSAHELAAHRVQGFSRESVLLLGPEGPVSRRLNCSDSNPSGVLHIYSSRILSALRVVRVPYHSRIP